MLAAPAAAQEAPRLLPENSATRVSEHVYAIVGFPNIAIVIGGNATLVVDTGMGARNGAIIVREVERLSKTPKLFLTTTHFHPEHATGEQAFPAHTILIRPRAQQEEMDRHGQLQLDVPLETETIVIDGPLGTYEVRPRSNRADLFAGKRVLLTLSKNNRLEWIKDWIR